MASARNIHDCIYFKVLFAPLLEILKNGLLMGYLRLFLYRVRWSTVVCLLSQNSHRLYYFKCRPADFLGDTGVWWRDLVGHCSHNWADYTRIRINTSRKLV